VALEFGRVRPKRARSSCPLGANSVFALANRQAGANTLFLRMRAPPVWRWSLGRCCCSFNCTLLRERRTACWGWERAQGPQREEGGGGGGSTGGNAAGARVGVAQEATAQEGGVQGSNGGKTKVHRDV